MAKRKRPCVTSGDSIDYISDLPDMLRLHILSLLPLKSAIVTGVLSSKWRNLWAYRWPHPSSLLLSSLHPSLSLADDEEDFVSVTNRTLSQRGVRRVDSIKIVFRQGEAEQSDLKRWLDYASSCSVEDFHLEIRPPDTTSFSLRRSSFPSTRRRNGGLLTFNYPLKSPILTRLSIRGTHLSASSMSSSSPSAKLESLFLHSVTLTDAALKKIVSSCPLLRVLDIRACKELKKVQIGTSGSRFKSLTFVDCPKASELTLTDTRGIKSFRFGGNFLSSYSIVDGSRLEEVYFSCSGPGSVIPISNWIACLARFINVRVLTLCTLALHYIAVSGGEKNARINNFNKLEELQLLIMMMSDSNLSDIFTFFKVCKFSHLNRLFLELPTCTYDPFVINYMQIEEENPPEEHLQNLETIKIRNYKGHQNETCLIKYLLSRSPNLKSLIVIAPRENFEFEFLKGASRHIVTREDLELEFSNDITKKIHFLYNQILLFPKASENVKILFCCNDLDRIQPIHNEIFSGY